MDLSRFLGRRWVKNVLRLSLLAVALYYIVAYFRHVDLSMLFRPTRARLAGASLLVLAAYAVQGLIWTTATRETGRNAWRGLAVFYASNIYKYIPGKVWQFAYVAAEGHRSQDGVRYARSLFFVNALSVLSGLSLFWVYLFLRHSRPHYLVGYAVTTLLATFALQSVDLDGILRRIPLKFLKTEAGATRGAYGLIYLELAAYMAVFALAMTLLSFKDIDVSAFLRSCLLFVGWALGFLAFVLPQGIGVREASLVWLLDGLVSKEVMMQLIVFFRLFPLVLELLLFAVSYAYLARLRRVP